MKNIITILSILLAVFCTSCKKDNIAAGEDEQSDGGIELSISLNGEFDMNSRSALLSSEPMHHIEHMYAYLFEKSQSADGDGLTVENAVCVYEQKLPWTASANAGNVFRCRLKPGDGFFDVNKEYLVMVVATDNNKDTYTFPWSDDSSNADIHLGMTGQKLSEVKMALATSAEPEQMAYTEVFAGFRKFTTSESLINVKLTRRVAGVICYLTDIPAKINDYHIIGAELHWSGGLNKSGVLKPGNLKNDEESFAGLDFDVKVEPKTTLLAKINLKEMGAAADASGELLYIPAINQEGVLKTLPNTAFMGAYMLPVQTEGQFIIKLVGEKRNVDGDEYVFKDTDTDGYYTVNNSSSEDFYTISADYIYNIGYKPYSTDTDYDAPLSLKGKSFVVKPSEWNQDIEVDVDFSDTQLGIMFDTGKTADFRYDCASTTDNTLSIKVLSADYNEKRWTLTTVDSWLHFIDDAGQAVQTISGTGKKKITIKVDDYIKNQIGAYNPDEDFRTATVTLTVADTPISSTSYIRQWNALIVPTVDEDGKSIGNIAFRRLDNGAVFKNDGTVDYTNVKTYQWAYDGKYPTSIFNGGTSYNTGDNGLINYQRMYEEKDEWINTGQWDICAVNLAKDGDWYLPARIELHSLINKLGNTKSAYLEFDGSWWSATAVGGSNSKSYCSNRTIIGKSKLHNQKNDYESGRTNNFRARLAHQIP